MIKKQIRILLIEDNPVDKRLIRKMLKGPSGISLRVECKERLDSGLECLKQRGYDVLLLDLGLPDSQGLNTFLTAQALAPEIPIVALTRLDDEELGLNAVQKGAQDFLVKEQAHENLLIHSIHNAIERKKKEKKIEYFSSWLEVTRHVNRIISKEKDRDLIIQGVCDILVENRGYYNAWIAITDKSGKFLTAAEKGLGKDFLPLLKQLKRGQLPYCANKVLSEPGVFAIKNPPTICVDCPLAAKCTGRGGMSCRLENAGNIYGLLTVSTKLDYAIDEEEQFLFSDLAGGISLALHNIKLERQRTQSEKEIKDSEKRLEILFQHAPDAIYLIDTKGIFVDLNLAAEKIIGRKKAELIGKSFVNFEMLSTDQIKRVFTNLTETFKGTSTHPIEYSFKRRDGSQLTVEISSYPVKIKRKTLILGIARDITDRKQTEEALKKRTHDLGERVKKLNCFFGIDEISRKEGIMIEELLKKTVRMLPPSWQYPEITGSCITFEGKKYKTRNFKKTKWMQRADITTNNKKVGLLEVCYLEEKPKKDKGPFLREEMKLINAVSERLGQFIERKEAKERMQKDKEFSEGLIDAMQDGFSVLDPNGIHINVNEALCKMTGFSRKEILGAGPPHPYWPPEEYENIQKTFEKTLQGKFEDFDLVFMRKNGERFPVIVSPSCLKNEKEEFITYFASVKDITKRKQAENQIKASLREKEVLLKEIHHRVKNNMQIITSLINLQSRHIMDEKALETFRSTQNRIKSMTLVHERMYQSKNFARVDFARYVQILTGHLLSLYKTDAEAIRLNSKIKDIFLDINTAIPCGLIVNELISNSLKHAFPDARKGEINIAMHQLNKKEIELIVSDNGIGLPEEIDFRNTESLGLHLVTILAEDQLHGGIKLDRKGGTKFYIKLKVTK